MWLFPLLIFKQILIAFILASVGLGLSFISYLALQSSIKGYRVSKQQRLSSYLIADSIVLYDKTL